MKLSHAYTLAALILTAGYAVSSRAADLVFTRGSGMLRCNLDEHALGLAFGSALLSNRRAVRSTGRSQFIEASWVNYKAEIRRAFTANTVNCPTDTCSDESRRLPAHA